MTGMVKIMAWFEHDNVHFLPARARDSRLLVASPD
jgi:hypothetical protein